MRLGATEATERVMIEKYLPELSDGEGKNILYIGANQVRPPHHAATLVDSGWRVHLLEAFLGNLEFVSQYNLFDTLTWGDIRSTRFPPQTFDAAIWWHGPEHITHEELYSTLDNIQSMVTDFVVLGCPHGKYIQGAVYGNDYEKHLWSVEPQDLEEYGYKVVPYKTNLPIKHLLAWRFKKEEWDV